MSREEAWNRIDAIIARHEIDDDYVTITSILDYDALRMARKALEQEPSGDLISREPFTDSTICEGFSCDECSFNRKDKGGCILEERVMDLPSVKQEPKTGHWITKDGKEQGYDIGGIKTWYIQIMCDKCGFIKTAIEGHTGQYKYCPSCGCRMVEPQERSK